MLTRRICVLLALMLCLAVPAMAAEVESDGVYCFGASDFAGEISGICITALPEENVGAVYLGQRQLRPGDVLAASQLEGLTFIPKRSEADAVATLSYLPIYPDRVAGEALVTISIRGKENQAPAAEDFAAETYKNLPIDGKLKVKDPENEEMTYAVARNPKRGTVELHEDGTFTYTPKKNKVGIDSFVYTATDASGKVSREATVTITIVKPTDSTQYTDTAGRDCRFAAEWMKNTGIFVGEKLDGNACFQPEKAVTKGEFLTMLVKTLDIPRENQELSAFSEAPQWLRPYLAAAVRSGIAAGVETAGYDQPISGAEAAVLIQNALDLTAAEAVSNMEAPNPSVAILESHGIQLGNEVLTRSAAAQVLYQTAQLAKEAPGMTVIARQK